MASIRFAVLPVLQPASDFDADAFAQGQRRLRDFFDKHGSFVVQTDLLPYFALPFLSANALPEHVALGHLCTTQHWVQVCTCCLVGNQLIHQREPLLLECGFREEVGSLRRHSFEFAMRCRSAYA